MTEEKPCRHEYVRIYQRRLKGLDRRLVATRAFLPVGFKVGDFGHLSEGSYCFCTKCRKRLFPKRSPQEKLDARIEKARAKAAAADLAALGVPGTAFAPPQREDFGEDFDEEFESEEGPTLRRAKPDDELDLDDELDVVAETDAPVDEDRMRPDVEIDELVVESVDVEDIKAEGVKLEIDEEACELDEVASEYED